MLNENLKTEDLFLDSHLQYVTTIPNVNVKFGRSWEEAISEWMGGVV